MASESGRKFGPFLRSLLPFAGLFLLFAMMAVLPQREYFYTAGNLMDVARRVSSIVVVALGMTFVVIAGGIDLSVGSVVALAGVAGIWSMTRGASTEAGVLIGVGVGAACGLANGTLVGGVGVPAFIATLGMMGALRGLALLLTDGKDLTEGVPRGFGQFSSGTFLGLPFPVWVFLPLALAAHGVLTRTSFGRHCYALGGNPQAAFLAGIPTQKRTAAVYVICGAFAGLAGMIEAARILNGSPNSGHMFELKSIAAVVIGGAALTGGKGTIAGALAGSLFMEFLANACNLLDIRPFAQQIVIGLLIIAVVAIDVVFQRKGWAA